MPLFLIAESAVSCMPSTPQVSLPWDQMDPEFLQLPRPWDTNGIAWFMVWIGPISSVFDITTFLLLWFVFHATNAMPLEVRPCSSPVGSSRASFRRR